MKTAHDFLAPFAGPDPGPYLAYVDAAKAVQAVIDHYDPLPGKLELAYRVVAAPPPPVRLTRCLTCQQWPDACRCEQPPF